MERVTVLKDARILIHALLFGATLALLAPSPAAASGGGGGSYSPMNCNETVSGNVVLTHDLNCFDLAATQTIGLRVGGPNTTIKLNGYTISCYDPSGYKYSCQGPNVDPLVSTPSDDNDFGIDTMGFSNVKILGPGQIKGFDVGVYARGFPSYSTPTPPPGPSASNIKIEKVNVTGPDGRSDISLEILGPRPKAFGILFTDFLDTASTCANWDKDDGHTHGNEAFGNSTDNAVIGIAVYNSSRVHVHENFVHDNNDAGDSTTQTNTTATTFESHGIVVCADTIDHATAPFCNIGTSRRNKIFNNLVVDNGQNAYTDNVNCAPGTPSPYMPGYCNVDGGVTLVGVVKYNDVANNTVLTNNGDGISVRSGADYNRFANNTSLMNSTTNDIPPTATCTTDPFTLQVTCTGTPPPAENFWDLSNRNGGTHNTFGPNNRCLTQSAGIPLGVCKPGENEWWNR